MSARGLATTARGADASAKATAWCRRYARAHSENFTVVSLLLPRRLRPHFFALYAFCRWTDDLGDEAEGDRLELLDEWEARLRACYAGQRDHPLFVALGQTIDRFSIPLDPFLRLIEANRMDQRASGFATYADLLRYCQHSATPVGHLVLYTLGYRDERRRQLSDAICTGLQLANFWQDVAVDLKKGRVYLPREDMQRFGYGEDELRRGACTPAFRSLLRFEVARARALFAEGRALERLVDGRVRYDIGLFRLGGEAVLNAIADAGYDVLGNRPTISRFTRGRIMVEYAARLLCSALLHAWRGRVGP